MTFEFVTARKPVSVNNRNKGRGGESKSAFIASLHGEVRRHYQQPFLTGDLYARIIWFHQDKLGDPDNIIKPILDALKGVVYADDTEIGKVSAERINLITTAITIAPNVTEPANYAELLALVGERHEHILFVEVGILPSRGLYFGPVQ